MSSTFDVKHDALPAGLAALEASAGTGKTYTLTHIVARQIIEHDVKIDRFLIVTYTRAAAAELALVEVDGEVQGQVADADLVGLGVGMLVAAAVLAEGRHGRDQEGEQEAEAGHGQFH